MVLLLWALLLLWLLIANMEPSSSDEEFSVGFLAVLSLASFGNAADTRAWDERQIRIGPTVFDIRNKVFVKIVDT